MFFFTVKTTKIVRKNGFQKRKYTFDGHREYFAAQYPGQRQDSQQVEEHVRDERDAEDHAERRMGDAVEHYRVRHDDEQRRGRAHAGNDHERLAPEPVQERERDASRNARARQEHGHGGAVLLHVAVTEHVHRVEQYHVHAAPLLQEQERGRDKGGLPHGARQVQ